MNATFSSAHWEENAVQHLILWIFQLSRSPANVRVGGRLAEASTAIEPPLVMSPADTEFRTRRGWWGRCCAAALPPAQQAVQQASQRVSILLRDCTTCEVRQTIS